jgi:integrase
MTVRHITRRGERRWIIDILYKTAQGRKKRYRRDAQVQTRAAAHAEHQRLMRELGETGDLVSHDYEHSSRGYMFTEAVAHFRRTHGVTNLKPSTRLGYDDLIDRELLPRFGEFRLDEIGLANVAEMDVALAGDDLKPSTRRNVLVVLRSILRAAVEASMLESMPKLPRLPKIGRDALRPMLAAELELILAAAAPNQRLAFLLAAYAGLRASEVRGLRWPDVDLGAGVITVRRGICHGIESTPKSGHGRVIPIAEPLRDALEAAKESRKSPWGEVAITRNGKPWGQSGLTQSFERAQERAELSGWSFHKLRHFFVTELCRRGAPTHVVQRLAGHADLATTQRYAHVVAGDAEKAIALFGSG